MDFKELKKQIIDEINTKIVSLITHPTFEKSIFKESAEYKGMLIKPAIKQLYDKYLTLHLPLSLIINPKHKYANRYVNHMICFKAYNYYHTNGGNVDNILDYIEISGPNWCFNTSNSPLSARSIETLIAMNSVLENYDDICDRKHKIVCDLMSRCNSESECYIKFSNGVFGKFKNIEIGQNKNVVQIGYYVLVCNPYSSSFGEFRTDCSTHRDVNIDVLSEKVEFVKMEDIREYLDSVVENEISKYQKEIGKAEKKIADSKLSISLLQSLKNNLKK